VKNEEKLACQQNNSVRNNRLFLPNRITFLIRPGFEADAVERNAEQCCDAGAHGGFVRAQAWGLGDDVDVAIQDAPVGQRRQGTHSSDELGGIAATMRRIGVGEMFAEVTRGDCTQKRIAQGVQNDVAVAVCDDLIGTGDQNSGARDTVAGF